MRIIERKHLDVEKYNRCIETSAFPAIYALSWYLDQSSDRKWEVLVQGDYEAVMPLPFKRSPRFLWKKVYYQPLITQQLGWFCKSMGDTIVDQLRAFLERNLFHNYPMNSSCLSIFEDEMPIKTRTNMILPLDRDYQSLLQDVYQKQLRYHVRKNKRMGVDVKVNALSLQDFVQFYLDISKKKKFAKRISPILKACLDMKKGFILSAFLNDELLASSFIADVQNRLYLLVGRSTSLGMQKRGMHSLIDHLIEQNAGKGKILDFEGSEIEGVQKFFAHFGAHNQSYGIYNNTDPLF